MPRRPWKPDPGWWFTLILFAIFAWGVYEARVWPEKTRLFPLFISVPMVAICAFQLYRDFNKTAKKQAPITKVNDEDEREKSVYTASFRKVGPVILHMLAYIAGIWVIGFLEIIPVFTLFYLRYVAKEPLWRSALQAVAVYLFCWGLFDQMLHLPFNQGFVLVYVRSLLGV